MEGKGEPASYTQVYSTSFETIPCQTALLSTEYCNQVNQMGGGASVHAVWEGRSACRRAAGRDGEKEERNEGF